MILRQDASAGWGSAAIIRLAIVVGVVTGLGEGVLFLVLQSAKLLPWTAMRLPVSADILWVAPIVDLAIALAVGGFFALVLQVFSRPPIATLAVFSLLVLPMFDWLSVALTDRLHNLSIAALAAGLAAVLMQRMTRPRLARVAAATWPMLGLVALIAGATGGGRAAREAMAVRGLPRAAADAPNVLLIVVDTLRADHLSTMAYHRPTTPHLDRLAAEGVVFENAYATSSWTVPSHASLFTGRFPFEHRTEGDYAMDRRFPTIAERMQASGYRTGGFAANHLWVTSVMGFDRGFIHFEEAFHSPVDAVLRTLVGRKLQALVLKPWLHLRDYPGRLDATQAVDAVLRWASRNEEVPFFTFVNFFDVHDPYLPPQPYKGRFSRTGTRASRINLYDPARTLSPQEFRDLTDAYDESLLYVDDQIGRLVDTLKRSSTRPLMVVITSDHGEFLGEHGGLTSHGNQLYREGIHVPLIFWSPGTIPGGVRVRQPVTNAAVAASLLSLVGADNQELPGLDLSTLWHSPAPPRQMLVLSELGRLRDNGNAASSAAHGDAMKSVVSDGWQYVWREDGNDELFDLAHASQGPVDPGKDAEAASYLIRLKGWVRSVNERGTIPEELLEGSGRKASSPQAASSP